MKLQKKTKTRFGLATTFVAATSAVVIFGASAGVASPTAIAPTGSNDVQTTVRKSVNNIGKADGSVTSSNMVTQVSAVGNGSSTVVVPIGTNTVRNLDNFASVPAQNNNATFNLSVAGSTEQRIYSPSSAGPISVKTTATLDGKPINPDEVVEKTGVLAVNYEVVNSEVTTQTVTYKNAEGNDVTEQIQVDAPIGGTLDMVLPQGFNEITAKGASLGGDGTGATKASWSLVLFGPLGNRVANIGFQSRIAAGTLPQAKFTFLPIIPLDNSTIASTKEAYQGGAASGQKIFGAGDEIGANLLKLQAGAGELITGLDAAATGASTIAKGLSGTAVPGANKLAAGANSLATGLNKKVLPGANDLSDGAATLAAGLAKLETSVQALPASVQASDGYKSAIAGLEGLKTMLTTMGTYSGTIGLASETDPTAGTGQIGILQKGSFVGCITAAMGFGASQTNATLACQGQYYVSSSSNYLSGALKSISTSGYVINTLVNQGAPNPLGPPNPATPPSALEIVNLLLAGLPALVTGIQESLLGTPESPGITALAAGGAQLSDGASDLYDGLGTVADGADQLADGNEKLATGLVPAAEGAAKLATGLGAAVDGVGKIQAGAEQLRVEGSDKLAESGAAATSEYNNKIAQIEAIQTVGVSGTAIPYGLATGPNTQTTGVYQLTLAPASTGGSNALLFGLALLGLVIGGALVVFAWRRRA